VNIRRSFFICLPLGFVLAAAAYFGLFLLQLGVPSRSTWLRRIIEKKISAASAITQPKLLVVAGSSALYGISAGEIERQTGFPAYNFGTNAALGCEYLLHLTRKVCRRGDTVLLAFEYETYIFGGRVGEASDEFYVNYVLGHDADFVRSLSAGDQFRLALVTPGERLWDGVRSVFRKAAPDAKAEDFIREMLADIDDHGDQTGAIPERRPEQSPGRTAPSGILANGFPPSPPGFRAIREFCAWAKANDIRVVATFPNLCRRPEYEAAAAKKAPAQFHEFYGSLGVPVLGGLSESLLPEEQMFDTNYHPMRAAAIARTQRLIVHLMPHLRTVAPLQIK
jgi:hypothetical protein